MASSFGRAFNRYKGQNSPETNRGIKDQWEQMMKQARQPTMDPRTSLLEELRLTRSDLTPGGLIKVTADNTWDYTKKPTFGQKDDVAPGKKSNPGLDEVNNSRKLSTESESTRKRTKEEKLDIIEQALEFVCGKVTEEILNLASGNVQDTDEERAKILELNLELQLKSTQGQHQINEGGSGSTRVKSCAKTVGSTTLEWTIDHAEDSSTPDVASNPEDLSNFSITCENLIKCIARSSNINIKLEFKTGDLQGQFTQPSVPLAKRDTISSSATSLNQYSSFRDNNSITLTMTLIVMLYMYVFKVIR